MPASLKLSLSDAAGDDLSDNVTIDLFSMQSSKQYQVTKRIQREITITAIEAGPGTTYRVMVTPANYRIVQFFVMLTDGKTTEFATPVPVEPRKVVSIKGPDFRNLRAEAQQLLNLAQVPRFNDGSGGHLQREALYGELDEHPLLKACFLNVVAKSAATGLQGAENCLQHFLGLLRLEQDRFFVRTTAGFVEDIANSNSFHRVSSSLHEPMPGYHIVASYKTFDRYGNLQITLQRRGETGIDYAADVDIDDAQGLEHAFQILRNSVHGPTHPYDIREILLRQQVRVDPGYRFVFPAPAGVA